MSRDLNTRSCLLLLTFVVLGTYYPAIFSPFNSMDDPGTVNFLLNADNLTLREVFTPGNTYYRPLLFLTFWADNYLWGLLESFMHLENILMHLVNALLVFAITLRLSRLRGIETPLWALVASLLFGLHPINAESVNWVSGRTDPLACIFVLLSVFLLVRSRLTPLSSLLAALSLLVACLAKETAIFFLPAALIYPYFADSSERPSLLQVAKQHWIHLFVWVGTGVGFFAFRALAAPVRDAGVARVVTHVVGEKSVGLFFTLKLPLKAAGFYLKKLVQPFPLNFGIIQVSDLYLPLGVLVCLVVVWLVFRRTLSAFFFVSAAAVGCSALMIPLLGLTWTPLAERYMYIPGAFFVVGGVLAVQTLELSQRGRQWLALGVFVVLAVAGYGTAERTLLWQDNLALFQDTLKKSPNFTPAQNEVANALYQKGRDAEARAVVSSMQVNASLINYQYGLRTKASALAAAGDFEGAVAVLKEVLKDPGQHEIAVCNQILKLYEMQVDAGRTTRAQVYPDSVRLLSRLYELTRDPFYHYRLGVVHMMQKKRQLAQVNFAQAAAHAPANAVYRQPALKLAKKMAE
ncbi:hypothetical protein GMLC_03220 [Geomonas limicola]|uniref:O-GlcNAc transferase n=1 Tax=Geomonas limicola TaxID=2740186 RepID=A0A6V8N545_9BACT|nr:hypothetical protein [Geomonas limicola]GFO66743.1 hypothetical protein GMLC_03220 [Geomonas limicola]